MYRRTVGICRHSCAVGNSNSHVSAVLHAGTETPALTSLFTSRQFVSRWPSRCGPKGSASLAAKGPRSSTSALSTTGARVYHTTAVALEDLHHGNIWSWIQSAPGPPTSVWAPLVLCNPVHRSLSTWKPREKVLSLLFHRIWE